MTLQINDQNLSNAYVFLNCVVQQNQEGLPKLLSNQAIQVIHDIEEEGGARQKIEWMSRDPLIGKYARIWLRAQDIRSPVVQCEQAMNPKTGRAIKDAIAFKCSATITYQGITGKISREGILFFDANHLIDRIDVAGQKSLHREASSM